MPYLSATKLLTWSDPDLVDKMKNSTTPSPVHRMSDSMHQQLLDVYNIFDAAVIDSNTVVRPKLSPSAASDPIPVPSSTVNVSPVVARMFK